MNNPSYPVVQFLCARGKGLSTLLSAFVLVAAWSWGLATGQIWIGLAGTVGAGVLLGLLLSYVEVLRIIADTLLPKY
jgi:ABC-type uncharacterized transport system permease subunit